MAVTTLDYSHFTSGSKEQREKFAHALLDSFRRSGFAKLKGHAFSAQKLEELFTWGLKFFDQPLEVKNDIPNETEPRPMRGYTPWRVEEVGKLHHDVKIRFMTDSKVRLDGRLLVMLDVLTDYDTGRLGIEDGSLVERCVPSTADLRLTHYPAIPLNEMQSGRTSHIAPHTDFGPITLLFQNSTGGLEIEDRTNPCSGSFIPLPPTDPMEMIVNVSDTLTRWTNGKIAGGIHQVTIPKEMKEESGLTLTSRMSMAYLFKAERNVSVGPLTKFVSCAETAKYPDMTALEFQRWRNGIIYSLNDTEFLNGVMSIA